MSPNKADEHDDHMGPKAWWVLATSGTGEKKARDGRPRDLRRLKDEG